MNNAVFGKCSNVASRQRNKKKHRWGCLQGFAQENCTTVLRKDRTSQSHMSSTSQGKFTTSRNEICIYKAINFFPEGQTQYQLCFAQTRTPTQNIAPRARKASDQMNSNIQYRALDGPVAGPAPNAGPTCWAWCLHDEAVFKPFQKSLTNNPFTLRHWLQFCCWFKQSSG